MSISGISSSSTGILFYQTEAEKNSQQEAATQSGATEQYVSPGQALLNSSSRALNIMKQMKSEGITVTADSIAEKLEELQQDFQDKVKQDLKALKVSDDVDFRVALGDDGKIKVYSDHKDAKTVQKYFDDHPELAEDVADIEALSGLTSAMAKNKESGMALNQAALRKSLQMESIDSFFAAFNDENGDAGDIFTPQILSYANSKLSTFSGVRAVA